MQTVVLIFVVEPKHLILEWMFSGLLGNVVCERPLKKTNISAEQKDKNTHAYMGISSKSHDNNVPVIVFITNVKGIFTCRTEPSFTSVLNTGGKLV